MRLLKLILFWLLLALPAWAVNTYFISPNGSGTACTAGSPCTIATVDANLTIGTAGTCTSADGKSTESGVGACVHVLTGTSSFGNWTINHSGAAAARIAYVADTQWGPTISGHIQVNGNYNSFIGLQITNPGSGGYAYNINPGHDIHVIGNYMHDFTTGDCGSYGVVNETPRNPSNLATFSTNNQYIGNIIRHAGNYGFGSNYCVTLQGIYFTAPGDIIENNVISGITGWAIKSNMYPGQTVISGNTLFNNGGGLDLTEDNDSSQTVPFDFNTISGNIIVNNGTDTPTTRNSVPFVGRFGINWYHVGTLGGTSGTHNLSTNNLIYGNKPHDQAHHDVQCGTDASGSTPITGVPINNNNTADTGCPATNPKTDSGGVTTTFQNFVADTNSAPLSAGAYNVSNYKVKAGSNAVGGGTTNCTVSPGITPCFPSLDFVLTVRPNPPSIGAFELTSSGGGTKIIQVTPNPSAFPDTIVGNTSNQLYTLTNIGTGNVTITALFTISPTTNFGTGGAGGTCFVGQVLTPAANCTASAHFSPITTGALTANYSFFTDATAGTYVVPLSGTGLPAPAPDVTIVPLKTPNIEAVTLDQGLTPCPETGTPTCAFGTKCWKWTHDSGTPGTSCGNSSLKQSPSLDGLSREFDVSWTGSGGERFSILSNPSPNLDTASTAFVYDAQVFVNSLTLINQLEFDMNQVLANGDTMIFGTQCNLTAGVVDYTRNNSGAQWVHSAIPCTRAQWNLAPIPNRLIVTYHRDASGNITYDSWSLNGTTTLFSGAKVFSEFSLGWTPLGIHVLNFQINGSSTTSSTVAYLDQLNLYASAATLTFPTTSVLSTSAALQAVILNTGTAALSISGVSVTGPFQLTSDNCPRAPTTLAVQASCRATIVYKPVAAGASTGTLVVNSNASSGSTLSAPLQGTAVQSNLSVSGATSLTFSNTFIGATSSSQTVVVNNTGSGNAIVTVGASAEFPQTSTCVNGFTDNFSTGTLDTNIWTKDSGAAPGTIAGVNSGSFSTSNVDLSQGVLGLKVTQTGASPVTSVGAEVRSIQPYWYGTYSWTMREASTSTTPGGAGTVDSGQISSVFSFINNSETELDIVELEGQLPNLAQFTTWNTTFSSTSSSTNIIGLNTGFHTYKVVWAPGSATYFVDNTQEAQHTLNVPTTPAYAMANVWGTNSSSFGGLATTGVDRWMYVSNFTFTPSVSVIVPGGSCRVTVAFAPTQAGTRNSTLTVTPADGGPTASVTLGGLGVSPSNGAKLKGGVKFTGGVKVLH